jgi:Holliday junction resolvase RusA-like endonuclease
MKTEPILFLKIFGQPQIKKNSQKVIYHKYLHRNIVVYSASYTGWKNDCLRQMMMKRIKLEIDYPITLCLHFYVKDNRKKDISNLYPGIEDILVEAKVLADDNYKIVANHNGSKVELDTENPRTEITILRLIEEVK